MLVTIIADVLGKENNGTTVACMNLYRYLTSQGDTVRIVCCDKDRLGQTNYYVVPTLNLGCVINYFVAKNHVSLARADKKILTEAITGADIVHVMIPFKLGRAAIKIARSQNIPVTGGFHCQAENFTSHIFFKDSKLVNYLTYKNFYNKFYKYVDAIHYPTKFIQDVFEKNIKKESNGYVISNGVQDTFISKVTEKPETLKDKYLILFIGRFSREKSHTVLLKGVSKSKYKDKIQLMFAGCGPYLDCVKRRAKRLKINEPIINFYTHDELIDVINYCDLYCHPAEIELEGIACLEAIKCGLVPVISNSPRCATKYFAIDDNNLFKCNDSRDLAKKIDFWIENPKLKDEYRQKYLDQTNIFDQKACMEAMRNMLVEVIEKHERA